MTAVALTPATETAFAQTDISFEPCRLERAGLPAAFADCSRLAVPENPAEPDGETLEIFLARIRSRNATPADDPLLLINGGPGGSGVDLYLQARNAFAPTLLDRDIILVDQRGTGRSIAGLDCEPPSDLELETAEPDELRGAVESCIEQFPRDAGLFTTSVAVRDLDRVREALGAPHWNIYGVSYGTRVAQHYARRFPERVKTIILDGVIPPGLPLGPDIARDAQAALDALLLRCAQAAPCSGTFGDVAAKFAELLVRFEDDSIEVLINDPSSGEPKLFELTGMHLQSVVRLMSYNDATAALLPLVINEAHKGNFEPLAAQADLVIESVADSLGFAMHNSVVCSEDVPFFGPQAGATETAPYLGTAIVDSLSMICEIWPSGIVDEDFHDPLTSTAPALLLSGANDPVTPPAGAQAAAAGFERSVHIIGRGKGHGIAAIGCVPRLIREFISAADPQAISDDCLANEGPMPFFVGFRGPAP